MVSHSILPVFASSAIRRPSTVEMMSLALVEGRTAVGIPHDAQAIAGVFDDFRVVGPTAACRCGIDRARAAVAAGEIDHAVDRQRRADQGALVGQVQHPVDAQLATLSTLI
jgi:hypothetical protein